jgi:hypothetical protein
MLRRRWLPVTLALCAALIGNLAPAVARSTAAAAGKPAAAPGSITVSVTPGKPVATFRPSEALGAGVDGHEQGAVAQIYTPSNVAAMQSAGLQPLTYRLRTELGDEAWHWNPQGTWSDPAHRQGYWTSSATSTVPIDTSYGYRLPRRGNTVDQANNDGWSRIDDGDPSTFWKSDPYLDQHFTGEPNASHGQWVVVDLGQPVGVDAVRLSWGVPYATHFAIQYWNAADDPFWVTDPHAAWQAFPQGTVTHGTGGDATLRLATAPVSVRFVRLFMTESSGRGPAGSTDGRDALGYALRELSVGTEDAHGALHDLVRHGPSAAAQSTISVSSTDSWHRAGDLDPNTEQPGFDRVLRSGLTNGLPAVVPVAMLFGTPENARAEISFLAARGFPVGRVEMGEEADGQNFLPEDYGALFVQWARALHSVDPSLQLGGPAFQTGFVEVPVWADASGDISWLHRFSRYLAARGATRDFAFLSVEWYPFDAPCPPFAPQLASEPGLLADTFARWTADGFGTVPKLVTEYGYSAFSTEAEVDLPGALLNADFAAQFLTLGGTAAYLYGYEPSTVAPNDSCNSWGDTMMLQADASYHVRHRLPTYWAARLLTQTWALPGDQPHQLYEATVETGDGKAAPVTAYALRRPDGKWAVLVLNKDPDRAFTLDVRFSIAGVAAPIPLSGKVELHQYGPAQYHWKANGANGQPDRNLPPSVRRLPPGAAFTAPAYSLSVLVGSGPPG